MTELQERVSKKQSIYASIVLGGVVILLGIGSFLSMVWTAPTFPSAEVGVPLRGIASFRPMLPESGELDAFRLSVEGVDIGCINQLSRIPIKVFGKQIRLKGKICGRSRDVASISVKNRGSGLEGTVFQVPGGNLISTDYMPVTDGANEFVIEIFNKNMKDAVRAVIHLERSKIL